jgi:hypothetical protein
VARKTKELFTSRGPELTSGQPFPGLTNATAEILGDPYSKKSPLPSIGRLAVSPNTSSYQVLGQPRILQRHITRSNHPRIPPPLPPPFPISPQYHHVWTDGDLPHEHETILPTRTRSNPGNSNACVTYQPDSTYLPVFADPQDTCLSHYEHVVLCRVTRSLIFSVSNRS